MSTLERSRSPIAAAIVIVLLVTCSCGDPQPVRDQQQEERASSLSSELWAFGQGSAMLPAKSPVKIRLEESISSETSASGQRFAASLAAPLSSDGKLLALAGAPVWGELTEVDPAREVSERARLTMTLRGLEVLGEEHTLATVPLTIVAEGSVAENVKINGGMSAVGAVLGAISGETESAAISAGVGAAGVAYILTTKGDQVAFGPGAVFRFVLREPLELPVQNQD